MMTKTDFKSVDEYIATHPEDVQAILQLPAGAFAARTMALVNMT
jgi:hypothetical protein